jgi:hypothetical protein
MCERFSKPNPVVRQYLAVYWLGMDEKRELLRHGLATVAYRATRALESAPVEFGSFEGAGRKPVEILAHMGDLFDWALSMAAGRPAWKNSKSLPWNEEQQRFYAALAVFEAYLVSPEPLKAPVERLIQGPLADALTHVGQLAMLRRMAGSPTRGENFYIATIAAGQVSTEQPAPVKVF